MDKNGYKEYGISDKIIELAEETEKKVKSIFDEIDDVCEYNTLKVLKAFTASSVFSTGMSNAKYL